MALLDYLLIIPSLALSLAVVVPLTGVLVRFRANYTPRGLALDAEGSALPHTGPTLNSFWATGKRVYRLEGVSGFYKGLMPTLLTATVMSIVILLFVDSSGGSPGRHGYRPPSTGVLGTFIYALSLVVLSLPSAIITYRAITTPHKLPYFGPMKSLRVLLTPTERSRPWIIYLTPGLLATQFVHTAYITLVLGPLHRLLVPLAMGPGGVSYPDTSPLKFAICIAIILLSTGLLTPLEVITVRLAIQRNQSSSDYNSVSQEVEGDAEDLPEYAGVEEDVIGLRTENEPYTGLVDCAKTIVNEEGFRALYRAWWVTILGAFASALG
ncbi:hypothetical protein MIND_00074900 [Mycena indigotica]|uniref:Mitochondrial carrier n=1 Tax=Mycena indigotica TaxID=2126181 RepID=A0A8H6TH03_9AGAR|nr:uncharacterized protein MIND_00074900 [Mycena indigotica]KAF7315595.1 hypothetical protein MIND_00074900 [Mycena indigotica]